MREPAGPQSHGTGPDDRRPPATRLTTWPGWGASSSSSGRCWRPMTLPRSGRPCR